MSMQFVNSSKKIVFPLDITSDDFGVDEDGNVVLKFLPAGKLSAPNNSPRLITLTCPVIETNDYGMAFVLVPDGLACPNTDGS